MADKKRKLEDEELSLEQSPSKRKKSYSIDMKLKIRYSKNTKVCLNSERLKDLKLLLTGVVGFYSSWER